RTAPTHPMHFRNAVLLAMVALPCCFTSAFAARIERAIPFAQAGDIALLLDLHLPAEDTTVAGVVIWVHGGAWRSGSREGVDIAGRTAAGWANAGGDYRLSPAARFPAQIRGIKAAIRSLRARARTWQLPESRFVIAGSSAG